MARLSPCLKEVCDAPEKKHVVMAVPRTAHSRVGMGVLYGLKAREGVGKYTNPFVFRECSESRVYGDEFRTRDSAGPPRSGRVYVKCSGGRYVYHRRP